MNIDIVGKNMEVTEDMKTTVRQHLESKLDPMLKDFAEDMKNVELSVSHLDKKYLYTVSFNMWLPGKEHVYAEASNQDFINAVVDLREKVESQLKKYIGKLNENKP